MKKVFKVGLLAVALLVGANMNAQDSPIQLGVKAGINLSNMSGDLENTKAKIGFNVGVTADYNLTPNVALLTGVEFTTKGLKGKGIASGNSINLSYLQLPIHIGYKLDVAEGSKIIFHAGPYLAYGINGKYKEKEDGVTTSVDIFKKYDGVTLLKRFDFGVGFGVGAEFGQIGIGLGYDFGLTNINDGFSDENDKKISIKNQAAYLTVGYKF